MNQFLNILSLALLGGSVVVLVNNIVTDVKAKPNRIPWKSVIKRWWLFWGLLLLSDLVNLDIVSSIIAIVLAGVTLWLNMQTYDVKGNPFKHHDKGDE